MKYLTGEEILVIHDEIINETGGLHGVRDIGLFLSLIERPKTSFGGTEVHATVFEKAAAYFESVAMYHVFLDGNKRTSVVAAARFLFLNGLDLVASNIDTERFTLKVVEDKLPISAIAAWLKKNARKSSQKA